MGFLFHLKARSGRGTSSEKSAPSSRGGSMTSLEPPPLIESRRNLVNQFKPFDYRTGSTVDDAKKRRTKPTLEKDNQQSPAVKLDFLIRVKCC